MNDLLILAGCTGTGKTKLAELIFDKLNCVLISADSMQIYKSCNIATAKLSINELEKYPHECINLIEPTSNFSVAEFVQLAKNKIEKCYKEKKLPILVGGTGLYIESLLFSYDFNNVKQDVELREKINNYYKRYGKERLYNFLKKINPKKAEEIHFNNIIRVKRALEVSLISKDTVLKEKNLEKQSPYNYKLIFLNRDREEIYKIIDNRVDDMIKAGLIDEAKNIYKLTKGNLDAQVNKIIGYKELYPYFEGKNDLKTSIDLIKQHSKNYAKRQITWFKRYNNIEIVDIGKGFDSILIQIINQYSVYKK